jgi:hypothetical protein
MDVFRPVQIVTVVDTLPIVTTAEANQTLQCNDRAGITAALAFIARRYR